jgi:hypothetical protein
MIVKDDDTVPAVLLWVTLRLLVRLVAFGTGAGWGRRGIVLVLSTEERALSHPNYQQG